MAPRAIQVVMELDPRGRVISGRIVDREMRGNNTFYGWMQLIALLEAVRTREESTRADLEPG